MEIIVSMNKTLLFVLARVRAYEYLPRSCSGSWSVPNQESTREVGPGQALHEA
jgi:hypothetical protein